jgi:predicted dehydrogenase
MNHPVRLAIVGSGWRAEFFARLARLLPEHFTLVGFAVRQPDKVQVVAAQWGVPAVLTIDELVHTLRPELVVTAVPWSANEAVVTALVAAGAKVLSETPPAPDLAGLRRLWSAVGATQRVQVAEQYLLMPGHAARREIVSRGAIGTVSSVQVSSTHGYHAVSMLRGLLGAGFDPVTVQARRFVADLVDPLTRAGWTDDATPKPAGTVLATLDFGGGLSGLYDFTDNQWHNQLRLRRIVVRGSLGEIADDTVVHLAAPRSIVRSQLTRAQLGHDLNLDGHDTEHLLFEGQVVWRNPFVGLRLMDEEIAIATLMVAAARWVRDEGPPPYPLAQACQDHAIALAIDAAVASGQLVTTAREAWAG